MNGRWVNLYTMSLFVLISMILMSIKVKKVYVKKTHKPMDKLLVPPAQYSHMKHFIDNGKIASARTWRGLRPDNNIPGLLPGPRIGEDLGLKNNPILSLSTPIRAPLVDGY